ncbi:MAG: peptidoglycan-binding protein [Inquilinaceae bacterium]
MANEELLEVLERYWALRNGKPTAPAASTAPADPPEPAPDPTDPDADWPAPSEPLKRSAHRPSFTRPTEPAGRTRTPDPNRERTRERLLTLLGDMRRIDEREIAQFREEFREFGAGVAGAIETLKRDLKTSREALDQRIDQLDRRLEEEKIERRAAMRAPAPAPTAAPTTGLPNLSLGEAVNQMTSRFLVILASTAIILLLGFAAIILAVRETERTGLPPASTSLTVPPTSLSLQLPTAPTEAAPAAPTVSSTVPAPAVAGPDAAAPAQPTPAPPETATTAEPPTPVAPPAATTDSSTTGTAPLPTTAAPAALDPQTAPSPSERSGPSDAAPAAPLETTLAPSSTEEPAAAPPPAPAEGAPVLEVAPPASPAETTPTAPDQPGTTRDGVDTNASPPALAEPEQPVEIAPPVVPETITPPQNDAGSDTQSFLPPRDLDGNTGADPGPVRVVDAPALPTEADAALTGRFVRPITPPAGGAPAAADIANRMGLPPGPATVADTAVAERPVRPITPPAGGAPVAADSANRMGLPPGPATVADTTVAERPVRPITPPAGGAPAAADIANRMGLPPGPATVADTAVAERPVRPITPPAGGAPMAVDIANRMGLPPGPAAVADTTVAEPPVRPITPPAGGAPAAVDIANRMGLPRAPVVSQPPAATPRPIVPPTGGPPMVAGLDSRLGLPETAPAAPTRQGPDEAVRPSAGDVASAGGDPSEPTRTEPTGITGTDPTRATRRRESQAVLTQRTQQIQSLLRDLGYHRGVATGKMDNDTRAAIRQYQFDHGLTIDGRPSAALLVSVRAAATTEDGAAIRRRLADRVEWTRRELAAQGLYDGPIHDGIDAGLVEAIAAYQASVEEKALSGLIGRGLMNSLLVSGIQRALIDHGYYDGGITGLADEATARAIRSYEDDLGTLRTGRVSVGLLDRLRNTPITIRGNGAENAQRP